VIARKGLKDIINYKPYPAGLIATAYQNPLTTNNSYPVCEHGGWKECELQAYQLCFANSTNHDSRATKSLIDCHLREMEQGRALNVTAECASKLKLSLKEHEALQACASSGAAVQLLQSAFLVGVRRGIIGTPSVFINGQLALGWYNNNTALLMAICDAYSGARPAGCLEPQSQPEAQNSTNMQMCRLHQ